MYDFGYVNVYQQERHYQRGADQPTGGLEVEIADELGDVRFYKLPFEGKKKKKSREYKGNFKSVLADISKGRFKPKPKQYAPLDGNYKG